MKKILLIFLIVLICGCQKQISFEDYGYSKEESDLILSFNSHDQEYFKEYSKNKADLISNDDFIKDYLNKYLTILDSYNVEECIYIVNNNYLDSLDKYEEVIKDEYYLKDHTSEYILFFDEYNTVRDVIEAVNTKSCYGQYLFDEETDISKNYQMLVNKHYHLTEDYIPENLVKVDLKYTSYELQLESTCYEAYKKMYEDALKENLDLNIDSAYRSYQLQETSYNNFLSKDSILVVDTYSARPGHSEHQTGLAIDIVPKGYTYDNVQFSKEAKWLEENCYKYGFIIRYKIGKEYVSGYKAEPWQVRYVGDIAEDVTKSGLTYDEYYEVFIK